MAIILKVEVSMTYLITFIFLVMNDMNVSSDDEI